MAIDRYDQQIDYDDVNGRIEELESEGGYEVVRLRDPDEVLFEDDDEGACRAFIENEDYNPARVVVRRRELEDDDAAELERLRALKDEADGEFGEYWSLLREDYFDAGWAREEAVETGAVRRASLDEWPLNLIDWDDAATERRDDLYTEYTFDGATYYGREQ